jgi:hypothetical protein
MRGNRFSAPPIHVIARSEAPKQSSFVPRGEMDCFASLAMTAIPHALAFSRRVSPEFCSLRPAPFQSEGAGKAGCRLHPWVPCKKSTGVGPQVQPETSGFPCAMVYGLLRALPGDRAFLPPSPPRSLLLKDLMPASGHQDHTTSPSASGALVFSALSVHRIPFRVRDVAQRPSVWDGTAADRKVICANIEAEYFFERGWTALRPICPSG